MLKKDNLYLCIIKLLLLSDPMSLYLITNEWIKNNFKRCIELMRVVIKSQGFFFMFYVQGNQFFHRGLCWWFRLLFYKIKFNGWNFIKNGWFRNNKTEIEALFIFFNEFFHYKQNWELIK